jgi:uncharacterized membrane protein YqiK
MQEPSVQVQWAIIAVAAVCAVGLGIWLIGSGRWYVFAALVGVSVVLGLRAAQEGKPLYPGAPPRGDADRP